MIEVLIPKVMEYGLAGVILAFVGTGLYYVFRWLAAKGDVLITTHVNFVEKVDSRMENIETNIDGIKGIFDQQTSILDRIERNTTNGKHS